MKHLGLLTYNYASILCLKCIYVLFKIGHIKIAKFINGYLKIVSA